jgi:hypothetical protein
MLFSWDDRGSPDITYNYVNWTIEGVECLHDDRCPSYTQDVDLGLFITRAIPEDSLNAKFYFDLVTGSLKEVFTILGVIVFPERPGNWIRFFLSTFELEKVGYEAGAFAEQQKAADSDKHGQWWIAAYPVPDISIAGEDNNCYYSKQCAPSSDAADDAVEASWDDVHGGFFADQLVVTTHLLRGKAATNSFRYDPQQCIGEFSAKGTMGSVPIAMVSVMTKDQWFAGKVSSMAKASMPSDTIHTPPGTWFGGVQTALLKKAGPSGLELIRSMLQEDDRGAYLELMYIIRDLTQQQRNSLAELVRSWRAGNPLTTQQQALIDKIAVRLRNRLR